MKELIIEFLRNNHKHFEKLTEQNFDAWCESAEDHERDGYDCFIELKSWDSNDGHTHILNLR